MEYEFDEFTKITDDSNIGMFAANDAHPSVCGAGMGMFVWFDNYEELAQYLTTFVLNECILPQVDTAEHDHVRELMQALAKLIRHPSPNIENFKKQYNTLFKGIDQVYWLGTFAELCTSDTPWVKDLRLYTMDSDAPITVENRARFIEQVAAYGF